MAKGKKKKRARRARRRLVTAKKKSAKKSSKKSAKKSAKKAKKSAKKSARKSKAAAPKKSAKKASAKKSAAKKKAAPAAKPPPKAAAPKPAAPKPAAPMARRPRLPRPPPQRHRVGRLPVPPHQVPHRHGDTVRQARRLRTETTTNSAPAIIPGHRSRPQRPPLRPFCRMMPWSLPARAIMAEFECRVELRASDSTAGKSGSCRDRWPARSSHKSRPADTETAQNCCRNATPADNISWNGHNA